jgi:uncharacterized delta-60 repeat protein
MNLNYEKVLYNYFRSFYCSCFRTSYYSIAIVINRLGDRKTKLKNQIKTINMKKIITLLIVHFSVFIVAQPGTLDNGFNATSSGADDEVSIISIQSDHKIIIGGRFSNYNGINRSTMARLNVDGSLDAGFDVGTGANADIWNSDIQSDGKIVILGGFSIFNDTFRKIIARLNPNGSLDLNYDPGSIIENYSIFNMAIQSDDKIVVSSYPNNSNTPQDQFPVSRLNIDGSYDKGFIPAIANGYVDAITIQSDGKIVIGGGFNIINGISRNGLARLNTNGSLDASFNFGTELIGGVWTMLMQSDNKILIGGDFGISRFNTDGSLDAGFNLAGTFEGAGIGAIALQSDGKIVIGGDFTAFNSISRNGIARLNTDGSLDASFNPGAGTNGIVADLSIQSDGKIVIGGDFTSYNGLVKNKITRINGDTALSVAEQNDTHSKMILYPNPIQDVLYIQNEPNTEIIKITVTDLTGKIVLEQNNSSRIDVQHLTKGMYFLQAFSSKEKSTTKFVKE